jgi:energy-coupling factor transporter ATP-binding protein EcfA2
VTEAPAVTTLTAPNTLTAPGGTAMPEQSRLNAFLSPAAADLFHPIVHQNDIWKQDPFDVESIHAEARAVFHRVLSRAATQPALTAGRILLLLGESGSGKTHLMRAFRNHTHEPGIGYCGYLQMTSTAGNYARYVLSKLIEALDQIYYDPNVQASGLMRLSGAVLDALPMITAEERAKLREGALTPSELIRLVHQYADCALVDSQFGRIDVDLVRALLFLQRDDARIKNRVLKYLRCEDLAPADRDVLGGVVPRPHEESPMQMIGWLGQAMWAAQEAPLVLCLDQLEDIINQDAGDKDAPLRFRKVMDTAVAIISAVPSSVVVISCLEDYYKAFRGHLIGAKLDRIEKDPEPIRLTSQRSSIEVEAIIARRLQYLYEEQGAPVDESLPTAPFSKDDLNVLQNLRTRDVLDFCRVHREKCASAGEWVPTGAAPSTGKPVPAPAAALVDDLEPLWNDFRAAFATAPADDEAELAELLSWAITNCSAEIDSGGRFEAEADARMVQVEAHGADNAVDRILAGVCNKSAQGGGLMRQIKELQNRAGEFVPVIVRSTAFSFGPKTEIAKQVGKFITDGGRRAIVEDSDWRTMLALRAFREQNKDSSELTAWLCQTKPLTSLRPLQVILDLDGLAKRRTASANGAAPGAAAPRKSQSAAVASGALLLGASSDRAAAPVTLEPKDLTTHAAFLGGTGSGKTTLALNIIEQLLLNGVPAILMDRKGDLCGYADPAAWTRPLHDPADADRRQRLRDQLDVHVFTPGHPQGRPLTIPVVPDGVRDLPDYERDQLAGYAAAALGGMMDYKPRGRDAQRLAVLRQAIGLLGAEEAAVTVPALIEFIHNQDASLVNAVGVLDVKQFNLLAQDLQTLWLRRKELLEDRAERLDVEYLLGLGGHAVAGKTRLSVISTRFLGETAAVEFWVSQFLLDVTRWTGRRTSPGLQAVLLFDEADLYLPATRQPPTKAPMENLLRRARSAGVGLMLVTQSPGDFDYKCRENIGSWLAGKITQQTALEKMKPLFTDCRTDVAARLPNQIRGQFHLIRPPTVVAFAARPSLIATEQLPESQILELARAKRPAVSPFAPCVP